MYRDSVRGSFDKGVSGMAGSRGFEGILDRGESDVIEFIEVKSGLEEGERVFLRTPTGFERESGKSDDEKPREDGEKKRKQEA